MLYPILIKRDSRHPLGEERFAVWIKKPPAALDLPELEEAGGRSLKRPAEGQEQRRQRHRKKTTAEKASLHKGISPSICPALAPCVERLYFVTVITADCPTLPAAS